MQANKLLAGTTQQDHGSLSPDPSHHLVKQQHLKVALLGYRSNPFSGGQGVYLKYLSRALTQLGHSVDVISGEPYPVLDDNVNLIKLPGLNLFAADNHISALRPAHFKSLTDLFEWASMATGGFPEPYTFGRRLNRYLKTNQPDYDIIHDNQCLARALLKISTRYPLISTVHHPITSDRDIAIANAKDDGERLLIRRWHYFLKMQTKVASRLPSVLTVSENSRRDLKAAFDIPDERITVVYNGIDTQDFYPVNSHNKNAHATDTGMQSIVTTASADQPLKGTRHLLKALALLKPECPNLRLTIIGALKPGGTNEQLMRELGIADLVETRHEVSTEEIRQIYSRATLAVVPSDYEGFGLPAGEAMACGVPVVSSDGGALPEVVGDDGIVVPAKNPQALAEAIHRILKNPQLADDLSKRGLNKIRTKFSWQKAAEQTVAAYRRQIDAFSERAMDKTRTRKHEEIAHTGLTDES